MAYTYSEDYPRSPGYYVYRLWDAAGRCLYIGRTGEVGPQRLSNRLAQHKRSKAWWPDVARTDVAVLPGPQELWAEERSQIGQHDPLHNEKLRARCRKGHDLTLPGARETGGYCRKCANDRARRTEPRHRARKNKWARESYRQRPELRERERRKYARRRYGPPPGQGALW